MNSCILLSHTFIRENENSKIDQVNFSTKHFRKNNPNTYIILTGHGVKPKDAFDYCDYVYWSDDIIEKEINVGHPYLVNVGFDHALDKGFTHVCKSRSDGIHLIEDLLSFSHENLQDKKMLITQQTRFHQRHIGDLFMYGDLNFLKRCWDIDKWYPTTTGLSSLANNFFDECEETEWTSALINNCSFKDIFSLKWIDFRNNWESLKNRTEEMLTNDMYDFENYLWGTTEGWHVFNSSGKMVGNSHNVISEESWRNEINRA